MEYKDIKKAPIIYEINQKLIPTTQLDFTDENIEFFNSIINRCHDEEFGKIIRTSRGSFSYSKTILPAYDVRYTNSLIELTYASIDGMFRLQIRTVNKNESTENNMSGWKSFRQFFNICKEFGIDLDGYKINNGAEIKKEIGKYKISVSDDCKLGKTYTNAHHIDFHSSFPSGLVNTHSEFKPVIEKLYNGRKQHPEYKYILNSTIGYMQSIPCCKAAWAQLSRDAINDNNKRIDELAEKLIKSGRTILAFNTDGIWYTGDIYHDENEGNNICQWHNDHKDCIIRFKSAGAYEFIENDIYTPVIRGRTLLDNIKDRSQWTWGDIFNKETLIKKFVVNTDDTIKIIYSID